jgi:hypothetical protein
MKKLLSIISILFLMVTIIPTEIVKAQPVLPQGTEAYTYSSQPDATLGQDTTIIPSSGGKGDDNVIQVGEPNNDSYTARSLIRFDLSEIPSTATIIDATLSLWVQGERSDNARNLRVYSVTTAWNEWNADWNYATGTTPWTTPGGDIGNELGYVNLPSSGTEGTQIDITLSASAIQAITETGSLTDPGFILKMDVENNDMYWFYSSDYSLAAQRPKLVINYTAPPPTDPGWYCQAGFHYPCPSPNPLMSPYSITNQTTPNWSLMGGTTYLSGANLNCVPRPQCINNYPIYYKVSASMEWNSDTRGSQHVMAAIAVASGGAE